MRHELKFLISPVQYHLLRGRLRPFLKLDEHTTEQGSYFIRSIYFDSDRLDAFEDKNAGILEREKYRIRYYNGDAETCSLECKIKKGTRIEKKAYPLRKAQAEALLAGEVCFDDLGDAGIYRDLALKMRNEGFRARVTVDYLREAYVYPLSNLRITFDKEIAAGRVENVFGKERNLPNILQDGYMVLEVKYDEIIPEHISDIIASVRPVRVAASKYSMCMMARLEGKTI